MEQNTTPRGNIRNCPWGYNCDKTWDELDETGHRDIRFCDTCEKNVYQCKTQRDLIDSVLLNRCVAFHPQLVKSIRARHEKHGSALSDQRVGVETIEKSIVIGEVEADYLSLRNEEEIMYRQMHDRVIGDMRPEHLSFITGENGDIHAEVDFPGDYDRELVITISAKQVEKLMDVLDDKDEARIRGTLGAKFKDSNSLIDWLTENNIGWSCWSWGG